ncbi:MAG TPA: 7TM diverse intracellular signaling domain-containing protein [Rectinemataceae bacterium]|nr:7TM diverse intracellular signaling domain-containing protein [Rectinemataceae bacterium]
MRSPLATLGWIFACAICCAATPAASLEPIDVSPMAPSVELTTRLEIARDPGAATTVEGAAAGRLAFSPPPHGRVTFGYSTDAIWARFRLRNSAALSIPVILEYAYPDVDYATLYSPDASGAWHSATYGDQVPLSIRPIKNRNPAFELTLPPGADYTYYVQARSQGSLDIPLVLWKPAAFYRSDHERQILYGLLFGLILIMGIYNLFIFLFSRDPTYIAYLVFIVGMSSYVATMRGLSFEYFWPESPFLANMALPFSIGFADFGGTLFTMLFLGTGRNLPRLHGVYRAFLVITVAIMVLSPFLPYRIITPAAGGFTFILGILFIATGIAGLHAHQRVARFYTMAWVALVIGVMLTIFRAFGILGVGFFTEYGLEFGAGAEVLLLSLSLADKLNLAKRENEEAQRRIAELEKLKTLGVLAAGVAHEINTPNNAVLRNLPIISEVWRELDPSLRRLIGEAGDFRLKGWSAEDLMLEVPELLSDTFAAGLQIRKIVEDLKDYARDTGAKPPEDVDLGAVAAYASRLLAPLATKRTRSFSVRCEPDLPPVRANFQKLTQVTINIIENALQSLSDDHASVRVRVLQDPLRDAVLLECEDEGRGIDPQIRGQIFEPFFTTRREAGGMGLGLSVAYGIVRDTGGDIEIDSTPGKGTTVRVVLPASRASSA